MSPSDRSQKGEQLPFVPPFVAEMLRRQVHAHAMSLSGSLIGVLSVLNEMYLSWLSEGPHGSHKGSSSVPVRATGWEIEDANHSDYAIEIDQNLTDSGGGVRVFSWSP